MINYIQGTGEPYGKEVYPDVSVRYRALEETPQHRVKVVIIGQDPYPNRKDAMGVCFSVPKGRAIPGSLKNIYKALELSGFKAPNHGDLTQWAKSGVLLLNSSLTKTEGSNESHAEHWKPFITKVIKSLQTKPRVYWFMGKQAKSFQPLVTNGILYNTSHPSPIIPNNNFVNVPHFKNINNLLDELGIAEIDWSIK